MKYLFSVLVIVMSAFQVFAQNDAKGDSLKQRKELGLDSIVVFDNGYQTVTKGRATGSFTQVNNKTLNLQVGSSILGRLEGVAGSLAINKKSNTTIPVITVRGLSTINGPTAPLIILDNFPFEGDINSINPSMVESITILKDATAASIWGTKAGNGVIVINSKKGKFTQPLTTEFTSSLQVVGKPDLYYQHPVNSADYIAMEKFLFSKGYYNSQLSSIYFPVVSPVVELLDRQARGLISTSEVELKTATLAKVDVRDQYDQNVYNNTINNQYALNFSGGSTQMAWMASGGYDRNITSLGEKYERVTARWENTFRPVKDLKISGSFSLSKTTTSSGREGYTTQSYMYPYSRLTDDNGNPLAVSRNYRSAYTDTLGAGRLLSWDFYPADDYRHDHTDDALSGLIANISFQYHLGAGFNVEGKYQYQSEQEQTKSVMDLQSYDARYLINLYSQLNRQLGVINYIVPKGGILDLANRMQKTNNCRIQVNYTSQWHRHNLVAFWGNEIREIKNSAEAYRTYGYDPGTLSASLTDFKNGYPIITTGDLVPVPSQNDFNQTINRYVSFFGNAAYTWDKKYAVNLSGRRDASNLFGAATNAKWTPLWSAGISWDIAREGFINTSALPALKFRATYGYTGNADPSRSGLVTVYALTPSFYTGLPAARIRQFPNTTLRWEKVAITNLGIDFATRNILSGSLEWYMKKGTDLFALSPVDITAGLNSSGVIKNVASMKGSGVDIMLNASMSKGKFVWNSNLVFNYNTDKVTKAYISTTSASGYVTGGDGITAIEGRPIHAVITYKWAGLDHNTGSPQGYLNGKISTDYNAITGTGATLNDLQHSGSATPLFFGSFMNSVSWKQFELNFNIAYKFRYSFMRTGLNYGALYAGSDRKSTNDFSRRWQNPGDEIFTDIPSMIYPSAASRDAFYTRSSALVEKGDHIRFQFVNLVYSCKLFTSRNPHTSRMQVYANASNLGILWRANKKKLDPDYATFDIPASATYAIGMKFFFQ